MEALEPRREAIGREVNVTVYSRADFAARRKAGNHFLERVMEQPKLWLVGSEDALAT